MKSFKEFIQEEIISPSSNSNTMSFWHGGKLDYGFNSDIKYKKGRYEFGPGLYLTTHYMTAKKYSKGSNKLYLVTIEKGNNISDINIPSDIVMEFINEYVIKSKRKDIIKRIDKYNKEGKIKAFILNNIMVNEEALKSDNINEFRKFLVKNDVDYAEEFSTFGWHEKMLVLFNSDKIISIKKVNPKDKIETFNLPTKWN